MSKAIIETYIYHSTDPNVWNLFYGIDLLLNIFQLLTIVRVFTFLKYSLVLALIYVLDEVLFLGFEMFSFIFHFFILLWRSVENQL